MAHLVSIYVDGHTREKYIDAIRHINTHGSLECSNEDDRKAVCIALNLCKMVVDVYDRKERGELEE